MISQSNITQMRSKLTPEQIAKVEATAMPEEQDRLAQKHKEIGNFMNAPQPEKWKEYLGTKYGVNNGVGINVGYIGSSYVPDGKLVIVSWTPYESVAQQVVDNLKKAGWKYNGARVIVLDNKFLIDHKLKVNTHAGFFPFAIQRKDNLIQIVPDSPVINEELTRLLGEVI